MQIDTHGGIDSYVNVFETTTLFLEFSIEFESNDLTYHKPYSKKQQITYDLIKHLHEVEGLGYRRISQSLNGWGIPTERGNKWFPNSVFSVLKRKRQREERIENLRNRHFETKVGRFSLRYITFE